MPLKLSGKRFPDPKWIRLLAGSALMVSSALAQHRIDPARSTVTVRVYKAGLLSAFGHEHQISAPIDSGDVDPAAHKVELRFRTAELQVEDPGTSESERKVIRQTMLSPDVLDASRYTEIGFRSATAEAAGIPAAWKVHGELTLHGETHPVVVDVREEKGYYQGTALFKQTTFGIKPVKIAGGAVRVKDEVRIEFKIQLIH